MFSYVAIFPTDRLRSFSSILLMAYEVYHHPFLLSKQEDVSYLPTQYNCS